MKLFVDLAFRILNVNERIKDLCLGRVFFFPEKDIWNEA